MHRSRRIQYALLPLSRNPAFKIARGGVLSCVLYVGSCWDGGTPRKIAALALGLRQVEYLWASFVFLTTAAIYVQVPHTKVPTCFVVFLCRSVVFFCRYTAVSGNAARIAAVLLQY